MHDPLYLFEQLSLFDNVTHFVSGRRGGVSPLPYESLNLGFSTEDADKNVQQNRELLSGYVGVGLDRFVLGYQTHGIRVTRVEEADAGRGAFDKTDAFADTDALVTDKTGLCLVVNVADCVPVLLFDPKKRVIASIHAGWRGTYGKIVVETVTKMQEWYGCSPEDIHAGIGPSIKACCYEVDKNLAMKFSESFDYGVGTDPGRYVLDLPLINARLLEKGGVASGQIETMPHCTSCQNDRFFSHRKEKGVTGRFWAGIMLR